MGISDFRISGQSLIKESCHSGTSDDVDMKLKPVTKLDKRNKATPKNFGFLANLEQPGDRIPDTESAKFMFSLTVTFCLIRTENRTKKTQLSHYYFE